MTDRKKVSAFTSIFGVRDPVSHLSVLVEPYITYIFELKKTVESRGSINRIAPYGSVMADDTVYMKKSGAGIVGKYTVADVKDYTPYGDPSKVRSIFWRYNDKIMAEDKYIVSKLDVNYFTLIWIKDVVRFDRPIRIDKKNRIAWVVGVPCYG